MLHCITQMWFHFFSNQQVLIMSRIEADKQEERRKMCGSFEDVVRFFSFFYSVVVFFFIESEHLTL